MRYSIFFPLRSGSQRVINKNSRPFLKTGESLFQLKMKHVARLADEFEKVCEVVISTDDQLVLTQAEPFLSDKIKIDLRPRHLCLSTTKVQDLIDYVPSIVFGEHVFWLHATSPFVGYEDYVKALVQYEDCLGKGCDSLMSVNKIQQFIWDAKLSKVINVDRGINPWPNTQDLAPLYEINHAFYISSKANYIALRDRIGRSPSLYLCDGIKSIDIDLEDDFSMAKLIASEVNGY